MEREKLAKRHEQILNYLAHLPRKMISLHGDDHVAAFVLYDLCHEYCFNFERAAYFVDNPDFDCLQGVVGCARPEMTSDVDIWSAIEQFTQKLYQAPFNRAVKAVMHSSMQQHEQSEHDAVDALADRLELTHYDYCRWPMKHDNHGLLLFEKADHSDTAYKEHVINGASLLSFCPIF